MKHTAKYAWDDLPLGKVPDKAIAAQLGCRRQTVIAARQRLGIPAFDISKSNKGIDWDTVGLGLQKDSDLAAELGVAIPVVFNARRRRGIPAFVPRDCGLDWGSLPLGQYLDEVVARAYKVSQPTVTRHRNRLGILPNKDDFLTPEGEGANYPEALIDRYWHENGVPHRFQVRVGPYIADWVINENTVVEYAGMVNHARHGSSYRARLAKKVSYYQEQGWDVLVIYPEDLVSYESGELLVRRAA